jgi:heme/copper-type cytochrome/quinol oxidase subunit 4
MNKESLQAWNERLWNFPYEEPSKDILKRLASQWLQVVVVLSIPFVPIASGLVSFYVVHTTADNAAIVAATVFTGMVAMAALAYLIFSRQKGTWRV